MRLTGNFMPQFFTAARSLSLASFTAASGSPTISNPGRPEERKHSAVTSYPATPVRPRDLIFDSNCITTCTVPERIYSGRRIFCIISKNPGKHMYEYFDVFTLIRCIAAEFKKMKNLNKFAKGHK